MELQKKQVEVTIPLQNLVVNSQLIIHGNPKNLEGFYDPCLGEEKELTVRYLYKNKMHECVIPDSEQLAIPKRDHLIKKN